MNVLFALTFHIHVHACPIKMAKIFYEHCYTYIPMQNIWPQLLISCLRSKGYDMNKLEFKLHYNTYSLLWYIVLMWLLRIWFIKNFPWYYYANLLVALMTQFKFQESLYGQTKFKLIDNIFIVLDNLTKLWFFKFVKCFI